MRGCVMAEYPYKARLQDLGFDPNDADDVADFVAQHIEGRSRSDEVLFNWLRVLTLKLTGVSEQITDFETRASDQLKRVAETTLAPLERNMASQIEEARTLSTQVADARTRLEGIERTLHDRLANIESRVSQVETTVGDIAQMISGMRKDVRSGGASDTKWWVIGTAIISMAVLYVLFANAGLAPNPLATPGG